MGQPKGPQTKNPRSAEEKRPRDSSGKDSAAAAPLDSDEGARKSGHVETGREAREHGERFEDGKTSGPARKDKPGR